MGPRHHLSFCACNTACLASEILVSMGPSPHLLFLHAKQRHLDQTYKSLRVPDLTCRFVHAKQPRIIVYMGPIPYLWFLHSKQRLLEQNYKSLWVPDLTCRFVHAKQRDLTQNYWSLCVPALICDFCMQNSGFWTRISSLYGSQTSSVVFACKTAHLGPEFQVSMGPRPHLWFSAHITACLAQE